MGCFINCLINTNFTTMKKLLNGLLLVSLLVSCKRDKQTSWETDMLTPIVKSQLTVSDLLQSENVVANPDSTLKLVYSSELFRMNTDSFVTLPDSTFEDGASLESLELPNDTVEYRITMADIARSLGGFVGPLILTNHGSYFPIALPSETDQSVAGTTVDISMSDLFDELILDSGVAEVILVNETPFAIKDVNFSLNNKPIGPGSEILSHTFTNVPSKTEASEEFILRDDTINSELEADLDNITVTVPAGTFLIDTNEAVIAKVIVRDLKPRAATAVWPDQNVIDQRRRIPFASNVEVDFKDASIRAGEIYFELYSTLDDSIFITYKIPNVFKGTDTFQIDTAIPPPVPPATESKLATTISLDGYHFEFNGFGILDPANPEYRPDTINTYITDIKAKIKYTGEKKTLSLTDSVYVKAEVRDLRPTFARGYMRSKVITAGPTETAFDLFDNIKSGSIDLEDANLEIEVDNGMGASATAKFNQIKGENAAGTEVDLTFAGGNDSLIIDRAEYNLENNRTTHVFSTKTLNPSNSNITDFIENLPNKIIYEAEVELNTDYTKPDSATFMAAMLVDDPTEPINFVHHLDDISANLNLEVPLSVITDSLILVDTLDFSLNNASSNEVESGKFKLLIDNGFPFDATTSLYFLDDFGTVIDSLWTNQTAVRANVNAAGRVTSSNRSIIEFNIDTEKMERIKSASLIYVEAGFHTFDVSDPDAEHYKVYSNYSFGVKLVGDFKYKFSN